MTNKKRQVGISFGHGILIWGYLFALGFASAGCRAGSSGSGRIEATVEVDQALMLDSVHIDATAEGKSPLARDLPLARTNSVRWTILVSKPPAGLTVTLTASGMRGKQVVLTNTSYAQVSSGQTVEVILLLSAECVAIVCGNPNETCDRGTCVKKPTYGVSDGGINAPNGAITIDGAMGIEAGTDRSPAPGCPTGQHSCPGGCVASTDIHTCGASCTPCQAPADGTATCDGTSCGGACPMGKQLCMGACIDAVAVCASGCPTGQHPCGGLCPSVMDVKACGTSCLPCPVPAGAVQASCDGTRCDFQCMTGSHKCGGRCAADSDATACGTTCTPCPTDPNGIGQCVGGACGIACNVGYHSCGDRCVNNMVVASCGATSCVACQAPTGGGTVTCDGTACVPACPTGMKLCAGACIAMGMACSGQCAAGSHNCGGICAMDTSVNSCGTTSCAVCPKPTGAGDSTCNGTSCDFICALGYHRCATRCAPDNDPTGCGATCLACTTDPNGTAACVGGTCGLMCKSGFHTCGGKCVDNRAVANCGPTSCTACQVPTGGGLVACDGQACIPACPSGSKLCNGACIPSANACNGVCPGGSHNCGGVCALNTAVGSCGVSCTSCTVPSNGVATCDGTNCGIMCATGTTACGSACCAAGQACCSGSCAPLNTTAHCNICSAACNATTQTCTTLGCRLKDGQTGCAAGTDCVSGVCTACYPDADGDGFANKWISVPTGLFCGASCPAGTSSNHSDCLDVASNPDATAVNPDAFFQNRQYSPDPMDPSPDGWDWNCNENDEREYPDVVSIPTGCSTPGVLCSGACVSKPDQVVFAPQGCGEDVPGAITCACGGQTAVCFNVPLNGGLISQRCR